MNRLSRLIGIAALPALSNCGNSVVTTTSSTGTTMGSGGSSSSSMSTASTSSGNPMTKANKVDVLLMVDNSSSMADKQRLLATAVPELVNRLANPLCVDMSGVAAPTQPKDGSAPCPGGYAREFNPVADINVGIVDSSLGGMGSDACFESPGYNNNDKGELVARSPSGAPASTYMGQGFLAWDANGTRGGTTDLPTMVANIGSLVSGVGEKGCGYEQPLEAATRFLVVPKPYASLQKGSGGIPPVTPAGEDTTLEQQRTEFLRPDSLLLVIALTDENDFSINFLGPQNYAPWNSMPFFRSSSICATNPGDKCCYSCGLGPPSGCPSGDASCQMNGGHYLPQEDGLNLKESQPKKKYGFDPNFPVKRYVNAFSKAIIDPSRPDLVPSTPGSGVENPIFSNTRDPGMVFFAAIVGVPYQAIARDPQDLGKGLLSSSELNQAGFWDAYVGDPDIYRTPTNPIMQESTAKRPGVTAGAPNGGDRTLNTSAPTDIQYACIFQLPTPKPMGLDCSGSDAPDSPLCSPGGGEPQINAKAYPGLRELAVVHGLGDQGIAASICPQNSTDPGKPNFGYRPTIDAIVGRMKTRLQP